MCQYDMDWERDHPESSPIMKRELFVQYERSREEFVLYERIGNKTVERGCSINESGLDSTIAELAAPRDGGKGGGA